MNFAYDWAFAKPIRKIYYNLTITGLSVFVALFIGTVEILGLIAQETNATGGFWDFMVQFNINRAGFMIVGIFAVTWVVALCVWHFGKIEHRWERQATEARIRRGDLVPSTTEPPGAAAHLVCGAKWRHPVPRKGGHAPRAAWSRCRRCARLAACGSGSSSPTTTTTQHATTTTATPTTTTTAASTTTTAASGAQNLPVTDALRTQLLAVGAALHNLPVSDYTGLEPGVTYYAYDAATKT